MPVDRQAPTDPGFSTNSMQETFSLPLPEEKTSSEAIAGQFVLSPTYSALSEIASEAGSLYELPRGQNIGDWISFLVTRLLWPRTLLKDPIFQAHLDPRIGQT